MVMVEPIWVASAVCVFVFTEPNVAWKSLLLLLFRLLLLFTITLLTCSDLITIFTIMFDSLFVGYVQIFAFSHLVERHEHEGHQVVGVEAKLASASRARGPL